MISRLTILAFVIHLSALERFLGAADTSETELQRRFSDSVHPFIQKYCVACHGTEKPKGQLDLSRYATVETVVRDYRQWDIVLEKLADHEMPPEEAKQHPVPALRQTVINWIRAVRRHEAERNAGDPGPVLARRLSNAEYDYTIRDLTGVDIRPTKEFPLDPANEAGFDNSGESLSMSPALLKKYLEAARHVAEHLVLKPNGFVFAPHPVVTETDRDKYCVKRIVSFYQRQPTNYAAYFQASWCFKHRAALGQPAASLADFAAESRISAKYLATIWDTLTDARDETGPIAELRTMWRALPEPDANQPDSARAGCEQMRDFVMRTRDQLKPEFKNLALRGIAAGSQPFVLWKNRQYAANRMRYKDGASQARTAGVSEDRTLATPAIEDDQVRHRAALERFCRVFPDAFYVSERGRVFLQKDEGDRGRLLSAGFHLMVGYFRDDAPLCELVLDDPAQRELDRLWQELNFITFAPMRQYKDYIFFERAEPPRFAQGAEFDFARSEDKDATSEAKIQQLAEVYLAKVRKIGGEGTVVEAIEHYFKSISADIRWVEQARLAAEPSQIESLLVFAESAYRRPLSQTERTDLLAFYRTLREDEGLDHEEAIRDTVVSVLMSPHFCYRLDLVEPGRFSELGQGSSGDSPVPSGVSPAPTVAVRRGLPANSASAANAQPLSDYGLASRLSYFLWSSMPDEALLASAATGELHRPAALVAHVRRMLRDDRIRGLATEFGGNWLDFRRFENHNSVDRERFQSFNDELRQAMFEEPIRFFSDLIREDRSVLNFLYGDYTFVNPVLAKHYGVSASAARRDEWTELSDARRFERGGLLPMAVFLTQNAPGLRTSPVKRGYWVVRRLLGEHIPPPPPTVPELPNDEAKLGQLTLRETLARHREDKSCAGCHERFDSFGLVFEGYGPIGERREKDLGGRPVETSANFPGGSDGTGLDGLVRYLREHRENDFLDNLCRKLLAYGLGRSLLLSDDAAIRELRASLAANGYHFSTLVEGIVMSPQFLNKQKTQP